MIFGAMAAWQAWLLLAGAAAAAAGLFLIKLRPPRVLIPSLLLWRRVLDESRELTLWERIRRAVSLVVTVLIALAIALAITRPGRISGTAAANTGRLLIILDSSWSMQARTRSGETRWERAVAEARRMVTGASGGEIALATTADGLIEGPTADSVLIETALDRIAPGGTDNAAWPRLAGASAVHFLTDGASARSIDRSVVIHSVFEPASNVAVTALDVRPSLAVANAGDAYLEIANFAPSAQKVRLTLQRGTTTIFDKTMDAGPSEVLRQVIPLVRGGDPALRARVDAPQNALDVDDEAVAWIDRAQPLTVTVVGERTTWLRTAFARDPGVRATFVSPAAYRPGQEDAVVFVGWAPADPPARPTLLFAPPTNTTWLSRPNAEAESPLAAAMETRPRWEIPGTHPVVQGVDPFTLSIERARAYTSPTLVPVAQSARGTPLVYVSESPDRRLALVTFGADESNLAGAPGFPVLLGNALDWLTHPIPSGARHIGLLSFDEGVVKVTGPDDAPVPLARVNRSSVGSLRAPGLYVVEGGGARSTIAVNAGDPQVSNLTRTSPLTSARARTVEGGSSGRPLWLYFAAAAFALALLEWWTWQRRITV